MRFNAAPAGGQWAADVGGKTTLRLFTDKTIAVSAKRNERSSGEGLLLYCMATWVGKCVHAGVRAPTAKAAKLWLVNPVFVRHLRSHLDEHGGRGRLPSAGLVGISHALSSCSRVSLFGFGNASDTNATGTCGHYWECNRNQSKYFAGKQARDQLASTNRSNTKCVAAARRTSSRPATHISSLTEFNRLRSQGYHEWKAQWRLLSQWLTQRASTSAVSGQIVFH